MRLYTAVFSVAILFVAVSAKIDPQNLRCLGLFITFSCNFFPQKIFFISDIFNYSVPPDLRRAK